MRKISFIITLTLVSIGCQEKTHKPIRTADVKTIGKDHTKEAQEWLKNAINSYFEDKYKMEDIATQEYAEYKSDATNVDYDGLTLKEFEKKWNARYITKYAGVGTGFLIPLQDWGQILIMDSHLLSKNKNIYTFRTTLKELDQELYYKRDIVVTYSNNGFLISDVLEYKD
jgi:hypothetical protein